MEIGRGVHIGSTMNGSNGLLQLPSFSYVLMFLLQYISTGIFILVFEYNVTLIFINPDLAG